MYTTYLAAAIGLLLGLGLYYGQISSLVWSVVWGLTAVAAGHVGAGLWLRRRVQERMNAVQQILTSGQKRLQQKVGQWQRRPPASIKQAQLEIEREQKIFLEQALAQTRAFEPFHRWSPLLRRQTATLRMQLHYQMHDYQAVDRLMPECLVLEPLTAAMKLARMHVRNAGDMARFFKRQTRRLRYGQGALLYALYAWILVKRGDIKGAHEILIEGCRRAENETLKANRDCLANNRPSQFSNAGLGDEWYALGLEEPRVKTQRARNPGGRPF